MGVILKNLDGFKMWLGNAWVLFGGAIMLSM
jgi:hypothetical protein